MGHFGHTYLPMSDVFYTMPITLVRFLLRYLPTPKSDVLYERSLNYTVILMEVNQSYLMKFSERKKGLIFYGQYHSKTATVRVTEKKQKSLHRPSAPKSHSFAILPSRIMHY